MFIGGADSGRDTHHKHISTSHAASVAPQQAMAAFSFFDHSSRAFVLLSPPCVGVFPTQGRKTAFVNMTALAVHSQLYLCACSSSALLSAVLLQLARIA
jgi:hypothetical protein